MGSMLRQTQAEPSSVSTASGIPGAEIVARIRRLIVIALVAVAVYAISMVSSRGYCPGGVDADGAFVDASGQPVDVAPLCATITLRPSALVYVAVAAVVLGSLTLVMRRASDIPVALRYLDRAAIAIAIIVVVSVTISRVWFTLIPLTEWDGSGSLYYPFPFGSVDLDTERMSNGMSG